MAFNHHSGTANRGHKYYRQRTKEIYGYKVTIKVSNVTKYGNLMGFHFTGYTFFCNHDRKITDGFVGTCEINQAFEIAEKKIAEVLKGF